VQKGEEAEWSKYCVGYFRLHMKIFLQMEDLLQILTLLFFLFSILILFTSFSSLGRKEIIVGVGCGGGDGCFLVDAVQAGISV